jgi:hypothetical protein
MDFTCPDILIPDSVTATDPDARKVYDYGRALWFQLAETRRYLRDCVAGGDAGGFDAQPGVSAVDRAVLQDDGSWHEWGLLYAQICSTLAGSSGDRGFGRGEAVLIARSHGVTLTLDPERRDSR